MALFYEETHPTSSPQKNSGVDEGRHDTTQHLGLPSIVRNDQVHKKGKYQEDYQQSETQPPQREKRGNRIANESGNGWIGERYRGDRADHEGVDQIQGGTGKLRLPRRSPGNPHAVPEHSGGSGTQIPRRTNAIRDLQQSTSINHRHADSA